VLGSPQARWFSAGTPPTEIAEGSTDSMTTASAQSGWAREAVPGAI
jgi:hypothetical protein